MTGSWQFWAFLSAIIAALTAIFAAIFLGERLAAVNWTGVALIATGAVLVALKI